MKRFFLAVLFLLMVGVQPVFAQSGNGLIAGDFFEDLFNPHKQWLFEIYNNTGCSIDIYLRGEYRKTLEPGESVVYKIRVSSGYYMCFTVNARMNGYYSTRSYDYTVRYTDTCGPRPVTFTRYDFPSEATQRTQEGFVITVVNASTNSFEIFRDGKSLGTVQPGELKALQTTQGIFLIRSSQGRFISMDVRSQSVLIIKDFDFQEGR
ncbi:MAG: hypothetical protein HZA36_02505 [Parcubacteria group bacterium]|nr:hypothetical protein [Parcubacteria group bacterium]